MNIDLTHLLLATLLGFSLTVNIILVWFVKKLTKSYNLTINTVNSLGEEVEAFAEATDALCESEVYLLGEEPVVKAVRNNAKMVLKRVENILRNIPSEWQLSQEVDPSTWTQTEYVDEQQQ